METSAPQRIVLPTAAGQIPTVVYEDVEYALLDGDGSVAVIASWRWLHGELRQTAYSQQENLGLMLPTTVSEETGRVLANLDNVGRLVPYEDIDKHGVFQVDNLLTPPFWSCRIRVGDTKDVQELVPRTVYHCWYGPSSTPDLAVSYDVLFSIVSDAHNGDDPSFIRDSGRPPGYRLAPERLVRSPGSVFVWNEQYVEETALARL